MVIFTIQERGLPYLKTIGEKKKTVLFATHNLNEASQVCDRIAILHKGSLRAHGTLDELREKEKSEGAGLEEMFLKIVKEK